MRTVLLCLLCTCLLWLGAAPAAAFPQERIALLPVSGDVPPALAAELSRRLEQAYRLPIYERLTPPLPARLDQAALEELRRDLDADLLLAIRLETFQQWSREGFPWHDESLVEIRVRGTLFAMAKDARFAKPSRKLNAWELQPLGVNSGAEKYLLDAVDDWLLHLKQEQLRLRRLPPAQ